VVNLPGAREEYDRPPAAEGSAAPDRQDRGNASPPLTAALPRRLAQCPKCGEAALIRIEGCDQCTSCDYSKCG